MKSTNISSFANSLVKDYIPEEGPSFSLFRIEILSGLTVALALVPEAIAFAFVAGVTPLSGLYAAFIVGLITAIIGGRPGMISGATGALAVVMVSLVVDHGAQYLFATVVLMGILQILSGIFRLGKFIRMVPQPVMLGFVNGLAIVIGISQLNQFKTINSAGESVWMSGNTLIYSYCIVVITMIVIWILPKFSKVFPSTLVAILLSTGLVISFNIPIPRVGDLASVAGGLPSFSLFRIEILSGLTVALALVPEAIAFAFVAGVPPLSGLYAAFIVGLITAIIGGRPGMISGATGALAVVMVSLVVDHGAQYLLSLIHI